MEKREGIILLIIITNKGKKIRTKEINHAQHKSDNDEIQELIMLLQDLFLTILLLRP